MAAGSPAISSARSRAAPARAAVKAPTRAVLLYHVIKSKGNEATVITPNVAASNGLIHVIDKVLIS